MNSRIIFSTFIYLTLFKLSLCSVLVFKDELPTSTDSSIVQEENNMPTFFPDFEELQLLIKMLETLESLLEGLYTTNGIQADENPGMQKQNSSELQIENMGNKDTAGSEEPNFGKNVSTVDVVKLRREMSKAYRIHSIKQQILSSIGGLPPPNSYPKNLSSSEQINIIKKLNENSKEIPQWPFENYPKKTQSSFPSCGAPRHTSKDEWNSSKDLNLFFNTICLETSPGTVPGLVSAVLRLYKQLPFRPNASSENSESNVPSEVQEAIQKSSLPSTVASLISTTSQEKQIRVSVYYYTRSLKKGRVKRTLTASGMLPLYAEQWTEWDVKRAVNTWMNDSRKNFGLSISVEDDEGNQLPATKFFHPFDCSRQSSSTLKTSDTRDREHPPDRDSQVKLTGAINYPMLETAVMEIPESQANSAFLYQYTKSALEQRTSDIVKSQCITSRLPPLDLEGNTRTDHRIRHHGHHRKLYSSDLEIQDSEEDLDPEDKFIVKKVFPIDALQNGTYTNSH